MSEVYDIIMKCAELRGVKYLINRSINEFQFFVMSVLFGDELPNYDIELHNAYYLFVMKQDDVSLGLAMAFEMYCNEVYGDHNE